MSETLPPFCMEALLPPFAFPPFAYLDRPIDEKVENSPTWGMAWGAFYMVRRERIPEYVRLCVLESVRMAREEVDHQLRDWNTVVQGGVGERFGKVFADLQNIMIRSLGPIDLPDAELTRRIEVLSRGAETLLKRMPAIKDLLPTSFVER